MRIGIKTEIVWYLVVFTLLLATLSLINDAAIKGEQCIRPSDLRIGF